ncbi:MAG: hypothetical protein ACPG5U_11875 [Planktomarina sp.]
MKQTRNAAATKAHTVDMIKDALGAFAIMAMLYIGLFIPAI